MSYTDILMIAGFTVSALGIVSWAFTRTKDQYFKDIK